MRGLICISFEFGFVLVTLVFLHFQWCTHSLVSKTFKIIFQLFDPILLISDVTNDFGINFHVICAIWITRFLLRQLIVVSELVALFQDVVGDPSGTLISTKFFVSTILDLMQSLRNTDFLLLKLLFSIFKFFDFFIVVFDQVGFLIPHVFTNISSFVDLFLHHISLLTKCFLLIINFCVEIINFIEEALFLHQDCVSLGLESFKLTLLVILQCWEFTPLDFSQVLFYLLFFKLGSQFDVLFLWKFTN